MNDLTFIWFLLVVALIWSTIWKGIALWKSARYGQKAWFIVLIIVNTIGLLEIIYLAFFQKRPIRTMMRPVKAAPAPAPKKVARKRR
ncbi:MAG: DUF5652 family protein [archaeon]